MNNTTGILARVCLSVTGSENNHGLDHCRTARRQYSCCANASRAVAIKSVATGSVLLDIILSHILLVLEWYEFIPQASALSVIEVKNDPLDWLNRHPFRLTDGSIFAVMRQNG
uniref:hypothetical protein n=1 Tax=Marinobacterium profundum TaxID=1714300 RepID=UPI00131518A1|nr:hypothetical protein [Marinobacterium profundum]